MNEFVAFRTLWDAIPFSEESAQLICDCLDWYVRRSGKPIEVAEQCIALYKLTMDFNG